MALEPITRQEKIIAGQDLTPITRMEKFLKQFGGGGGGGGSADAVLYTQQTLTEAQKKQARENIDIGVNYFVVNGTENSNHKITLDKTFSQIREAIGDGKIPIVAMGDYYFQLSNNTDEYITFLFAIAGGGTSANLTILKIVVYPSKSAQAYAYGLISTSPYGTVPQFDMSSDPVEDMQIATKQYVDNKECILKSTTPGSTKEFKITVDDSGTISATEVT